MAFDTTFGKFIGLKDKFDSQFMIICHDITLDDLKDKIIHQVELIKLVNDTVKRNHLLKKITGFRDYLENMQNRKIISSVFFIHSNPEEVRLTNEWCNVLKSFNVDKYMFKRGDYFDIGYLKSLLTDTSYHDIIHVNNNTLTHFHLNSTKKKTYFKDDKSTLDVEAYVKENVKDYCVVHGVSGAIKNLKSTSTMVVNNGFLKDTEIFNMIERILNTKNSESLNEWLNNITNPKLMHRLVFGKDIEKRIITKLLKTLYCSPEFHEKIKQKVPEEFHIFEIVVVKSLEKGDIGNVLKTNYSGAVGVTFY